MRVAVLQVFTYVQNCDFRGINRRSEVQWGAFAASTPQALSSALSFVNRSSPDWKMRWDVCHCHAHLQCSACSLAVCNTAGCVEEGCAGPNWHPTWTRLNRDHTFLCFGNSCRVGVPREGTECSAWLKPEKKQESVYFSGSREDVLGCFTTSNWLFC